MRNAQIVAVRNVGATFAFRYKPARIGVCSFRATVAGDVDTRASSSPTRKFRVIRWPAPGYPDV